MTTTGLPFSDVLPLMLFLAKATLLLVAALAATASLRRSTAGARHLVWLAAIVGVLALPVLSRIPSLRVGLLPSGLSAAPATIATQPTFAPTPMAAAPALAPAHPTAARTSRLAPPTVRPTTPSVIAEVGAGYAALSVVAVIWGAVALALVTWLVAGAISVRRIVARARELTSPDWTKPLCEAADRLDLDVPPRLVLSDRSEMAFACRALSPTIVLPMGAESWPDDRRRAVLFHELAHVKRHDLVGHVLGRLACALYWFHPLVWTAAKRLRAESERACDDLVLSCGARPSEYAQHLLDMVTAVRNQATPVMALPMARKKEFEGRMLAILDPAVRRASPGRLQTAVVVATIALLSLSVAAVEPAAAGGRGVMPSAPAATLAQSAELSNAYSLDRVVAAVSRNADSPFVPRTAPAAPQASARSDAQHTDTARTDMLVRILANDSDASVRRTAAWGLNELHGPSARAALIKALVADADWSVREMAAWSLADYDRGADIASALGGALRDKHPRVRATAAWALGTTEGVSEAGELESAVADSDSEVRHTAIWALGQLGQKTAPRLVVNALTDNSQQVRMVAAWSLGEFADPSTVPAIVSAFQTETDQGVRTAEMHALAAMDQMPRSVLDVALQSKDAEIRRVAVGMLSGSGAWPWPWPWPWPRPSP